MNDSSKTTGYLRNQYEQLLQALTVSPAISPQSRRAQARPTDGVDESSSNSVRNRLLERGFAQGVVRLLRVGVLLHSRTPLLLSNVHSPDENYTGLAKTGYHATCQIGGSVGLRVDPPVDSTETSLAEAICSAGHASRVSSTDIINSLVSVPLNSTVSTISLMPCCSFRSSSNSRRNNVASSSEPICMNLQSLIRPSYRS